MKKNEIKEQVRSDLTLLEENEKLKSEIKALRNSADEMDDEIKSLRSSIGSYKAANTRMKRENAKLKVYAREADEMNEIKANSILELEKQLQAAINDVSAAHETIKGLEYEMNAQKANIYWYNSLPWYRKIFVNKF